jgi:hypothetical protein
VEEGRRVKFGKRKKMKRKIIIKIQIGFVSNLEGNRLANESLDVFLQLPCPLAGSIFGIAATGAASPTAEGITSINWNKIISGLSAVL